MNVASTILSAGDDASVAIFSRNAAVTYRELRRISAEAAEIASQGTSGPGERIGIFSENNAFFIAAYLGIIRGGMVAVPFQTECVQGTFDRIVKGADIRRLFVSDRLEKRVRPWAENLGVELVLEQAQAGCLKTPAKAGEKKPQADSDANDQAQALAALMFTSGSTGEPKGVMISHRNIECNTRDIIEYMGLTAADRVMVVLPFHYCYGLSLLHSVLMAGGTLVLNNEFKLYPDAMLREMLQKECSGFAGVPSTYQILLRTSRFKQMCFRSLRWLQQAGGKLPNPCIEEIRNSFPSVKLYIMYGQTEATARLSYLPPDRLVDKLGSIGKGLKSGDLEVLKRDGTPVAPGSEEVGEIVASGKNVGLGYWKDPAETSKFFRRGKLHTGDLARVDKDGFIYIVERERDMIKSGGHRVSAKETEDVIAEIPEVVEVAVVGAPHNLLGESIKAFVVLRAESTICETDILAHCRSRLPAFKTPEEIVFLKVMPHNGAGKVMKQELRSMVHASATRPMSTRI